MPDQQVLADMYHAIMVSFVETGRAPHYTELGKRLGLAPEQARQALHDLADSGLPFVLVPDTDFISSLAPFSNLPTPYRISVEGEQRWYGQ